MGNAPSSQPNSTASTPAVTGPDGRPAPERRWSRFDMVGGFNLEPAPPGKPIGSQDPRGAAPSSQRTLWQQSAAQALQTAREGASTSPGRPPYEQFASARRRSTTVSVGSSASSTAVSAVSAEGAGGASPKRAADVLKRMNSDERPVVEEVRPAAVAKEASLAVASEVATIEKEEPKNMGPLTEEPEEIVEEVSVPAIEEAKSTEGVEEADEGQEKHVHFAATPLLSGEDTIAHQDVIPESNAKIFTADDTDEGSVPLTATVEDDIPNVRTFELADAAEPLVIPTGFGETDEPHTPIVRTPLRLVVPSSPSDPGAPITAVHLPTAGHTLPPTVARPPTPPHAVHHVPFLTAATDVLTPVTPTAPFTPLSAHGAGSAGLPAAQVESVAKESPVEEEVPALEETLLVEEAIASPPSAPSPLPTLAIEGVTFPRLSPATPMTATSATDNTPRTPVSAIALSHAQLAHAQPATLVHVVVPTPGTVDNGEEDGARQVVEEKSGRKDVREDNVRESDPAVGLEVEDAIREDSTTQDRQEPLEQQTDDSDNHPSVLSHALDMSHESFLSAVEPTATQFDHEFDIGSHRPDGDISPVDLRATGSPAAFRSDIFLVGASPVELSEPGALSDGNSLDSSLSAQVTQSPRSTKAGGESPVELGTDARFDVPRLAVLAPAVPFPLLGSPMSPVEARAAADRLVGPTAEERAAWRETTYVDAVENSVWDEDEKDVNEEVNARTTLDSEDAVDGKLSVRESDMEGGEGEVYEVVNTKLNVAMDLSGADFHSVLGWHLHGSRNQQWVFNPLGKGFSIRNAMGGGYLSVEDGPSERTEVAVSEFPVAWRLEPIDGAEGIFRIYWPSAKYAVGLEPGSNRVKLCSITNFDSAFEWRFTRRPERELRLRPTAPQQTSTPAHGSAPVARIELPKPTATVNTIVTTRVQQDGRDLGAIPEGKQVILAQSSALEQGRWAEETTTTTTVTTVTTVRRMRC